MPRACELITQLGYLQVKREDLVANLLNRCPVIVSIRQVDLGEGTRPLIYESAHVLSHLSIVCNWQLQGTFYNEYL